jgi:putative transferase (TIGR04331 family)
VPAGQPEPPNPVAPVFLATTALEDFWRTEGKVLFLSEACRLFSRRDHWGRLDAEVVDHPWKDRAGLAAAQRRLPQLGEACLDRLAGWLNQIHGENFSRRYWRIVVGPFVFFYAYAFYSRHIALTRVFSRFPAIRTLGISADDYRTPIDTQDFVEAACNSDRYNLQLHSQIIDALNPGAIERRHFEARSHDRRGEALARGKEARLKQWVRRSLVAINRHLMTAAPVTIYLGTASAADRLRLVLGSKAFAWPIFGAGHRSDPDLCADPRLRAGLPWREEPDPLLRAMLKSLVVNLPLQFVEGYAELALTAAARFRRRPRCIVSDSGWYFDESFKVWAARSAERGVKLVAVQHGGTYGDALYCPHESHEKAIADVFVSWGWQDAPNVRPLPSPRLRGGAGRGRSRRLLWTSTAMPRYQDPSDPMAATHRDYLEMQFSFAGLLDPRVQADLLVRLYVYDYGWSMRERWRERFPRLEVQVPGRGRKFAHVLAESRLFIGDNPGTTYLEALARNKPTLLFWRDEGATHRSSSHAYYDGLRRVGIFHDSPESAARQLNSVYPRIEDWWQQADLQQARRDFCGHFARASKDWMREWLRMLRTVAP